MRLFERDHTHPATNERIGSLADIGRMIDNLLGPDQTPIRFAVTGSSRDSYRYEIGILEGTVPSGPSMFDLHPRLDENTSAFNAVLIVPTGIGAEIGGHAGDATPVARLLASVCDTLITHPNVVNASDLNEMPPNGLYVEGSLLSRFLMGAIGLRPVRSNRVLVIIDAHPNERFARATVNAVNAARSTYGLKCPRVVVLDPALPVRGEYTQSGRAAGTVGDLERVFNVLDTYRGEYDAVALSTLVDVDIPHESYFSSRGELVNPWGGVEAMLTHAISTLYNVPSAHAPMMESTEVANIDPGVVDPRMAAEVISLTFLQSVLKGMHASPRIVTGPAEMSQSDTLTARDVSCLVIPDGCIGLPTLAALEQGIPVIAVRENRSLMKNDLTRLPWAADQLHVVDNYWEAVGLMAALKEGMSPGSVRRPLRDVRIERSPATKWSGVGLPTPPRGASEQ
ncbi:MAG: DUF3326 domain-containing protein [Chloroflexi bacterium]|nr:DUF3326 domain-containing protein [Chloroflexota bacterium]